jgi:hypothetical protein
VQPSFIRITPGHLTSGKDRPGRWPFGPGTFWRKVGAGLLPQPIKLGPGIVAYDLETIERIEAEWKAAAVSGPQVAAQRKEAAAASVISRQTKRNQAGT